MQLMFFHNFSLLIDKNYIRNIKIHLFETKKISRKFNFLKWNEYCYSFLNYLLIAIYLFFSLYLLSYVLKRLF